MRHRDEFEVKRTRTETALSRHLVNVDLGAAGKLGQFRLQHPTGEGRGINRRAQRWPQFHDRTNVVLVRMRDDDAGKLVALGLNEPQIGKYDVDAGLGLSRKCDPQIDHDPLTIIRRADAIEIDIHPDFAEAAQGNEYGLFTIGIGLRCAQNFAYPPSSGVAGPPDSATSPKWKRSISPVGLQRRKAPSASSPSKLP